MTDPYRLKSPAEVACTNFSLPLGVQLLQVYISDREYRNLQSNALRLQNLTYSNITRNQKKPLPSKSLTKEPVLSAMKRDQSLIFTTVPEEDVDHQSPTNTTDTVVRNVRPIADRPKSLNLRSTTVNDVKLTNKSINAKPESVVCTPFTGKTSVCSTPLAEKLLHGTALSICCNTDIDFEGAGSTIIAETEDINKKLETSVDTYKRKDDTNSESINSLLSTHSLLNSNKILDSTKMDFKELDKIIMPITNMFMPDNTLDKKRSCSMLEANDNMLDVNKRVTLRYYGIGLTNMKKALEESDLDEDDAAAIGKHFYNTITDPSYPVFRSDGTVISKALYDICLSKHCELLTSEFTEELAKALASNVEHSVTNTDDWKSVDDFDSELKEPSIKSREMNESGMKEIESCEGSSTSLPSKSQETRRALSLPLKSLSSEQSNDSSFAPFVQKCSLGGVQLTPLMSKLSLLAVEEKSSGFCSRDTTPSEFRDFGLTPSEKNYSFLGRKNSLRMENDHQSLDDAEDAFYTEDYQKVILFICGQQDMVLGLLLEEEATENADLIQKLVSCNFICYFLKFI